MIKKKHAVSSKPVIKCESVYKIFGNNLQALLRKSGGVIDTKFLQDSGCIIGVNDACFEVQKGELLVVRQIHLAALYFPIDGAYRWPDLDRWARHHAHVPKAACGPAP